MAMQEVRWGIIGCGDVTEKKSGPGFQKARGSKLVAVMRRDGAKAKDYAARHGVPRWYDDAGALLADPEVNAVYIATPPGSHREYTLAAAAAGKAVYVEKPMARTHAECQDMIAACEAAGVPLFVAYYRRALPRFERVRALVAAGAIGTVRAVHMTQYRPLLQPAADGTWPWRVQPDLAGGGLFADMGSHTLDFMDQLLGPVTAVQGHAARLADAYPAEDTVTASFRFAGGAQGTGLWCYCAGQEQECNHILGSDGSLTFSTLGDEPVALRTASGLETFDHPYPDHVQQPLIQTVVDELRGEGHCPSTGVTGARTSWVLDELLREVRGW